MDNGMVWLAVGGAVGWMMHLIDGEARQGVLSQACLGMAGAVAGGFLLTPLMVVHEVRGGAAMLVAVMAALIGAEIVLALARLARRRIEQEPRRWAAGRQ